MVLNNHDFARTNRESDARQGGFWRTALRPENKENFIYPPCWWIRKKMPGTCRRRA
jgi:hypothetical protein